MEMFDLKDILNTNFITSENIGVCIYAILKDADKPFKIDVEQESLKDLQELFLSKIKQSIIDNDALGLLKLSSADDRANVIYEYDLEIPNQLEILDYIRSNDNVELMNLNDYSLMDIKALIIEIGNNSSQLLLYKTISPVNVYGKSQLLFGKHKTRLEKVNNELLRITPDFQMLQVNGSLIILDLKTLERNFGFYDVIKKVASESCTAIENIELVENPETLRELIDDISYARKLIKIAKLSPVLIKNISNEQIIHFCETYPKLKGRIRFNETKDKIILDTKVSKNLFLQLLMDDLLTSELTKLHYTSLAKDNADSTV